MFSDFGWAFGGFGGCRWGGWVVRVADLCWVLCMVWWLPGVLFFGC